MNGSSAAQCRGKKVFRTYWQALRNAKNLNKYKDKARAGVYKCDFCHFWHVGNSLSNGRKKTWQ